MKREAAMIVLKLQNFEQTQRCMDVAQKMLTMCNDDPDLLKNAITGDESSHMIVTMTSPITPMKQSRKAKTKKSRQVSHHYSAPAHTSMLEREFLAKNKSVIMP